MHPRLHSPSLATARMSLIYTMRQLRYTMGEVLPWLLAFTCIMDSSRIAGGTQGEAAGGGGGRGGADPLDFLSSITGAYTHFVDDDMSVTLSYDLHDDSNMPFSFLTGCV